MRVGAVINDLVVLDLLVTSNASKCCLNASIDFLGLDVEAVEAADENGIPSSFEKLSLMGWATCSPPSPTRLGRSRPRAGSSFER